MITQQNPILDETDKKILQILQDNFPMVERPYKHVAEQLNLTEDQILTRLQRLNQQGITRKIGAVIDTTKVGLTAATLVALRVPQNKVEDVSEVINQYRGVSHNYEREHEYNVWFTLKAQSQPELTATIEEIAQKTAVNPKNILNLPTKSCFKINVSFKIV
jgi:DNA-binding Lrp family transcriptional regulator